MQKKPTIYPETPFTIRFQHKHVVLSEYLCVPAKPYESIPRVHRLRNHLHSLYEGLFIREIHDGQRVRSVRICGEGSGQHLRCNSPLSNQNEVRPGAVTEILFPVASHNETLIEGSRKAYYHEYAYLFLRLYKAQTCTLAE